MTQHCCDGTFWLYLLIIVGLVLFAGMMSGLTLGLMSLGLVDLEVLIKSGTPEDKKHAEKILPVVKNQHLLLCTLLIGNALAMEALPIFLDSLVNAWGAILISVTLILMFGEIIPQAVCSRYGLAVGAAMAPVVRLLVWVFFPVSYPISKILDSILGKGHVALFRRAELKTLVNMHGNEAGKGGELTHDETTIIAGALEMTEKTAAQAMTPISSAFTIDINAKLDLDTMNLVMSRGHSRLPVYAGKPTNIIGLILVCHLTHNPRLFGNGSQVKNLLTVRPEDETPVRHLTIRKIPRVPENLPLYDILNEFQKGHSHMAAVVRRDLQNAESTGKGLKRLSSILQKGKHTDSASAGPHKVFGGPIPQQNSSEATLEQTESSGTIYTRSVNDEGDDHSPSLGQGLRENGLTSLDRNKRWSQVRSGNVLELQAEEVPSFPTDEEVVGIITMEDVIEELLQEEILDETDVYIDVHERIRVNLQPSGGKPAPGSPFSRSTSLRHIAKRPSSPTVGAASTGTGSASPKPGDARPSPFAASPPRFVSQFLSKHQVTTQLRHDPSVVP